MNEKRIRFFITLMTVMLCMAAFSISTFAYSGEPTTNQAATSAVTATPTTTSIKPLTPDGTGTVIDNATSEDGKEFFTVTTPSKHVFYLIIDRQKEAENVYFLDSVTEKDLLALAESDSKDSSAASSKVILTPEESVTSGVSTPESATTTSQPKKQYNLIGIAAAILFSVAIAGTAIWFFKFRKPKNPAKGATDLDEYDFPEDEEPDDGPVLPVQGRTNSYTPETEDVE